MGYYKTRITERCDAISEPVPVYWFRFQELAEKKMRMQADSFRGGRRVRPEELACTDPRYIFHGEDLTTALELEKQHLLLNGYNDEDLMWIEQLVTDYLNKEKQSDVHCITQRVRKNGMTSVLLTPSYDRGFSGMRTARTYEAPHRYLCELSVDHV